MDTTNVREALQKAQDAIGEAYGPEPLRHPNTVIVPTRGDYVVPAPKVEADPRFAAYGEQLLAACRSADAGIDNADYEAWRRTVTLPEGIGASACIRLYREQRRTQVLDII